MSKIKCSGCGKKYETGTNCSCGYLSISKDALSIKDYPILGRLDYRSLSSDGKKYGYVCNNSAHEHCGKLVLILNEEIKER